MVVGGVISAAIAAALTAALGEVYIAALDRAFASSKAGIPKLADIEVEFRKQIRKGVRKARRDAPARQAPARHRQVVAVSQTRLTHTIW